MDDIFLSDLSKRPFQLRLYPDAVLRCKSERVISFTTELDGFMFAMLAFMKENNGIGLASPQVGIGLRAVVAEIEGRPIMLANPEIVNRTDALDRKEEGCLSLPGNSYDVERNWFIEVKAKTTSGGRLHFEAEGLFARVLQHEIDHLDGILICDKSGECENSVLPNRETPNAHV
jgi:peptide deformylase